MPKFKDSQSHSMNFAHMMRKAIQGDVTISASPVTIGASATTSAWTRTVKVYAKDAAGNLHSWLNQAFTATLAVADTASASTATASISSTTLTFVDGVGTVTVSGTQGTWAAADTDTLTVKPMNIGAATTATCTSVETFA